MQLIGTMLYCLELYGTCLISQTLCDRTQTSMEWLGSMGLSEIPIFCSIHFVKPTVALFVKYIVLYIFNKTWLFSLLGQGDMTSPTSRSIIIQHGDEDVSESHEDMQRHDVRFIYFRRDYVSQKFSNSPTSTIHQNVIYLSSQV